MWPLQLSVCGKNGEWLLKYCVIEMYPQRQRDSLIKRPLHQCYDIDLNAGLFKSITVGKESRRNVNALIDVWAYLEGQNSKQR